MGYDAYVACTCYAQGITPPPPHPELIVSDEYGTYLQLPNDLWEKDPALCRTMNAAFAAWQNRACAHPRLCAASERVANMSQMNAFRMLVEERGGAARYSVLSAQLPEYNGGSVPAADAPALLRELDELAAGPDQKQVSLREQVTGDVVYTVRAGTQELFVFMSFGRYQYGLDEEGFFITEKASEPSLRAADYTVRFCATRFSQQRLSEKHFSFIDLSDGQRFECVFGLRTDDTEAAEMAIFELAYETVPLAQAHANILTALRKLAEAAIATGNPICWT